MNEESGSFIQRLMPFPVLITAQYSQRSETPYEDPPDGLQSYIQRPC